MQTDLPSADQVVEELADRVASRIEHGAPVSFDAALDELVRYHRFLLGLSAQIEPDGQVFNYAEIEGSTWSPPHQLWIREYRRLFDRAADKIPLDTHFIDALSYVAYQLIQPEENLRYSREIVKGILSLLPVQVHSLEAWLTRRSSNYMNREGYEDSQQLAGSDSRSYGSALRTMVGAWESVVQMAPYYYAWNESPDLPDADRWDNYRGSWSLYWTHLTNTAYCVAAAVWNRDLVGAKLFAETLIRWPGSSLDDYAESYGFRLPHLLFPDLFNLSWAEASAQANRLAYSAFEVSPRALFASLIRGAHNDIMLITASLLMHWNVSSINSDEITVATARTLIREEVDSDEAPQNQRDWSASVAILRFMRLQIAGERFEDGSYGATLDHFVRQVDGMSERDIVPGRVFTPSTLSDREGLIVSDTAVLASAALDQQEIDIHPELREWFENVDVLPRGDRSLSAISSELDRYLNALRDPSSHVVTALERLVNEKDVDKRISALELGLSDLQDFIRKTRDERLRQLPIDQEKLELRRQLFERSLLTPPAEAPFFENALVEPLPLNKRIKLQTLRFVDMSKERFVEPPMGPNIHNEGEAQSDAVRRYSGRLVFYDLSRKKKIQSKLSSPVEERQFWDEIAPLVERVGERPILLVSADARMRLFDRIFKADPIPGVIVERSAPVGRRNQYVTTIAGVNVYGGVTNSRSAWLLSGNLLKAVQFAPALREGRFIELNFVPDADALKGSLEIKFRQRTRWGDDPIFRIRCPDPASK